MQRQPNQQSSAIELHRRALCLEEACSRLLSFVLRTAESSPTLRQLAQKDLQAALDCLSAGSGVFGAGECFWMPPPATHPALTRLAQAVTTPKADPHLRSTIDWLTAHRQEAFTRTYVAADELSWGLPLLGLVATLPLGRLHEPGAAEEARRALLEDHRDRLHVYQEDLKRLVVYGANLTHYVERVHALATAFRPLGQAFPEHCRPAELDSEGRMVGADAKPCALGHMQFALTGRRAPPPPFPMDCLNVKPNSTAALVTARYEREEALIARLGGGQTVQLMHWARAQILERLCADSHLNPLTRILPATASLPDAHPDVASVFA